MIVAKLVIGLVIFDGVLVALLLSEFAGLVIAAMWLAAAILAGLILGPFILWMAVARRVRLLDLTRGRP